MKKRIIHKGGFTLLEVLVGTAVLSMMVFMIWSISSTNLDAVDRVMKRDDIFQTARLVMRRITEDVNMAFMVSNIQLLGKMNDGSNVETAFIGEDKGGYDSVDFNSFSHWRMFRDAKESDQSEVGYYVEKDPDNQEVYRLMRRESTALDSDVTKGGKAYMVASGISKFKLSYYNAAVSEWSEEWNSREVDFKNKLPRAVKIEIAFPDPNVEEEEINFSTIAFVELWQYPVEF